LPAKAGEQKEVATTPEAKAALDAGLASVKEAALAVAKRPIHI